MNKLHEVNKLATLKMSQALTKMAKQEVRVKISKAKIKKVEKLEPIIPAEEMVAGIYLPVTGKINGASLLILPKETAFTLCDVMLKKKRGITRKLSAMDKALLKEAGNIISGTYLGVFANKLKIKTVEHLPSLSYAMFGAILSQIITNFAKGAKDALVIEIQFVLTPVKLKGYFLLMFKVEDIKKVLGGVFK